MLLCICWVCAPVGCVCGCGVVGYPGAFVIHGVWWLGALIRVFNSGVVGVVRVLVFSINGEGVLDYNRL